MQIRCTYCQMMFAINHEEMLAALEQMEEEKLKFYDAHCPKCRRANRIERLKLESAYPDWKEDLKKMVKETTTSSQPASASATASVTNPIPAVSPKKRHSHKTTGKPVALASKIAVAHAKIKTALPKSSKSAKIKPAKGIAKKSETKPAAKTTPKAEKKSTGKPGSKTAKKTVEKPALKTAKDTVGKPTSSTKKK